MISKPEHYGVILRQTAKERQLCLRLAVGVRRARTRR
jgi:hypothetical protein